MKHQTQKQILAVIGNGRLSAAELACQLFMSISDVILHLSDLVKFGSVIMVSHGYYEKAKKG